MPKPKLTIKAHYIPPGGGRKRYTCSVELKRDVGETQAAIEATNHLLTRFAEFIEDQYNGLVCLTDLFIKET